MDSRAHWETVYRLMQPGELSWHQALPKVSLDLVTGAVPDPAAEILDVGGGTSSLVDGLLELGYHRVTVLDISGSALEQAKRRLGKAAERVVWREADILRTTLPHATLDFWHDRAVFHFITSAVDRQRYVIQVRASVRPGGHVLVATFAEDGPSRCSGLEVSRYTTAALHAEFGTDFHLISSVREEHLTPWGASQAFVYCLCRFEPPAC